MALQTVASLDDLWAGEMRGIVVGRTRLLLVHLDEGVFAYEDRCAHQGVPLSGGKLDGATLTCPAHEWQYDVRTGRGVNPKSACMRRFPLEIRDGRVFVDLEAPAPCGEAPR
jgi:toluene monooxygenase system ferredoxin subunit